MGKKNAFIKKDLSISKSIGMSIRIDTNGKGGGFYYQTSRSNKIPYSLDDSQLCDMNI